MALPPSTKTPNYWNRLNGLALTLDVSSSPAARSQRPAAIIERASPPRRAVVLQRLLNRLGA
jgi:hypothetical protein